MSNDLSTLRHSLSHVLAMAVEELYPEAKLGIGPSIENGFYYDFGDLDISESDLEKIENKMREIIAKDLGFEKSEVIKESAQEKFKSQPYKLELINDIDGEKVSIYKTGDFIDLCKGPHISSTSEIDPNGFKLLKLAGAYWKGSEKNAMLNRIYGTAWETPQELKNYILQLEKAEANNHKKLGPKLGLFMFDETAPGMPYWLPKGLIVYNLLIDYWRKEHVKFGYFEVRTPLVNKKELFVKSGHWEHYKDNMFVCVTDEKEVYALKPMNCPNAMVIFKSQTRSYRDLPLRISDADTLHRYEKSGTLNGLLRVREFSQDDAHIFVSFDQIEKEYANIFKICEQFYAIFDLEYSFRLGTRPDKFMGDRKSVV